jgi:hypothetical protein
VNEFILEPDGNLTKVTWAMHGTNLYVMRLMGIFVSMDRLIGKHFEERLSILKAVVEQ